MDKLSVGLGAIIFFQRWLDSSGYGYLADGLGDKDPGLALLEIAKRAGVRGLGPKDSIVETLPMVQDLIKLRCKPKRPLVSER